MRYVPKGVFAPEPTRNSDTQLKILTQQSAIVYETFYYCLPIIYE